MADLGLSSFTTTFRVRQAGRIKRNRSVVSCLSCRARKIKCDRQQPCGACQKRGERVACHFTSVPKQSAMACRRHEVQKELGQVQMLLRSLISSDRYTQHGLLGGSEEVCQQARLDSSKTLMSLSTSIDRIQSIIDTEGAAMIQEPVVTHEEPDLLFGSLPAARFSDILETLPPRQVADRIIIAYFNTKYVTVPVIHAHQFRRQYEAFWTDPTSANILWISILFSILGIGAFVVLNTKGISEVPSSVLCNPTAYTTMAKRCLLAGHYLDAGEFSVEALVMHAHSRHVQRGNTDESLPSLFGLVIRLAQRQGYHRDPSELSFMFSPFEAEMRRRVWFVIQYYDVFVSFEQGLPPLIHEDLCHDIHLTNVTEDDFDEESKFLISR